MSPARHQRNDTIQYRIVGLVSAQRNARSAALIAVSYPWLTITFWFLARAFQIEFPVFWEIVYANLMVLLGFYIAIRLEELLDGVVVRPSLRWMSFLLLSAAVIVYVLFTYDPTYPFFTPPPGW